MSSEGRDEYDDYEHCEGVMCPRCQGLGSIDCHCGGDLCVCENYGEKDCPLCYGDGSVSEDVYQEERQRKAWAAWNKVFNETEDKDSTP